MKPKIQFWYEFASTYSYLSMMRIEQLAQAHNYTLEWKPFLLGPILHAQGLNDSPFNIYPIKGDYMWKDIERQCSKLKLQFTRPDIFPQNGLLAARIAVIGSKHDWCAEFSKAVYLDNFAYMKDISSTNNLSTILKTLKLDAEAIIAEANNTDTKHVLREHTDEAVRLGIFGAPSFIVNGELYWGNDRLEDALFSRLNRH